MSDEELEQFIDQPIDGLLYDLDLLPEQITTGSKDDLLRRVITELHHLASL